MFSIIKRLKDKYMFLNKGTEIISLYCKENTFERVLDLGCGNCDDLSIVKNTSLNEHLSLYGIDLDDEKLAVCRTGGGNFFLLKSNVETQLIPFEDDSFDLIIANQIFEHIKEIFWVTHEISRILKKGGKFILGVPNLASFHNRMLLLLGKHPPSIKLTSGHIRGFTMGGLQSFFRIGPLELLQKKSANFYPLPPKISKFVNNIFPNCGVELVLLYKKTRSYEGEYLNYLETHKLATHFKRNPDLDSTNSLLKG